MQPPRSSGRRPQARGRPTGNGWTAAAQDRHTPSATELQPERRLAFAPCTAAGWPAESRGETKVVSTASWAPPCKDNPFVEPPVIDVVSHQVEIGQAGVGGHPGPSFNGTPGQPPVRGRTRDSATHPPENTRSPSESKRRWHRQVFWVSRRRRRRDPDKVQRGGERSGAPAATPTAPAQRGQGGGTGPGRGGLAVSPLRNKLSASSGPSRGLPAGQDRTQKRRRSPFQNRQAIGPRRPIRSGGGGGRRTQTETKPKTLRRATPTGVTGLPEAGWQAVPNSEVRGHGQ